jgi:hypothetical protein
VNRLRLSPDRPARKYPLGGFHGPLDIDRFIAKEIVSLHETELPKQIAREGGLLEALSAKEGARLAAINLRQNPGTKDAPS